MTRARTKESQNQSQWDAYTERGGTTLGPWSSNIWRHDPRHLGFLLARYKFCAKMLEGKKSVLEIGCGDAMGLPVLLQTVGSVHGVDFEPLVLEDAARRLKREGVSGCRLSVADLTRRPVPGRYDAAYSLDVIEHIPERLERRFVGNIVRSLTPQGVLILGTPNITAQRYASPASRAGHINLKSGPDLRRLLSAYFDNVFLFSMNDEVVHTGYGPMAHYLIAMGAGRKRRS
ncbi:MAG: Ubiquinone biosynthesis O-methyltransferase [Candidatus Omnitrophica bacterium]|nr:Ubiquinone biosynthesis O-methyltransferase [Candidatus Omnitrophota bacterium]